MTGGQKTILFWVMTILCFLSPFIFFAFYKDKNVIIEMHPKPTQTSPFITIHVSGAVRNPGIYKIKPGTKVHEILDNLELWPNAESSHLNLAKTLRDGQKIKIKERVKAEAIININMASIKELKNLPGIGPSFAKKIQHHRNLHGFIDSESQLESIIGKAKLKKIRSKISF